MSRFEPPVLKPREAGKTMSFCTVPLESRQKVRLNVCLIYNEMKFLTFLLQTGCVCVCLYAANNDGWPSRWTSGMRSLLSFALSKLRHTSAHTLLLVLTFIMIIYLLNMFTQMSHT